MTSPLESRFDDCGTDFFHGDPNLDFSAMHNAGSRRFLFMKLSEGTSYVDPLFRARLEQLLDLDLGFGLAAYHFAKAGQPDEQISHFLQSFEDAIAGLRYRPAFLFMLDIERQPTTTPSEQDSLGMIRAMINAGVPNPIIYCGYDYWTQVSYPELAQCSHMVAAYNARPRSALPWRTPAPNSFGWDWWQYTGDYLGPWARDIPGGSHGMDLSCFNREKHPEGAEVWWQQELSKIRLQAPA